MYGGEGGCSPEGRKGQRGFLISKEPAQAKEMGPYAASLLLHP